MEHVGTEPGIHTVPSVLLLCLPAGGLAPYSSGWRRTLPLWGSSADSGHQAGGDFLPVVFLSTLTSPCPVPSPPRTSSEAAWVQISLLTSPSVIPTSLTPPSALRLCFLSSWNHSSAPKSLIHSFFFYSLLLKEIYLAEPSLSCCTQDLSVVAGGVQFPDQGSTQAPALGAWSLSHWTSRGVPLILFTYQLLCLAPNLFQGRDFDHPSLCHFVPPRRSSG